MVQNILENGNAAAIEAVTATQHQTRRFERHLEHGQRVTKFEPGPLDRNPLCNTGLVHVRSQFVFVRGAQLSGTAPANACVPEAADVAAGPDSAADRSRAKTRN